MGGEREKRNEHEWIRREMEETVAAPLCKDQHTPHVLISKAAVCDGSQNGWEGIGKDHHWPEVKAQG